MIYQNNASSDAFFCAQTVPKHLYRHFIFPKLNILGWCDTSADDLKAGRSRKVEISKPKLCRSPWSRRMILI
jgi:hypothetical protein